MAKKNNIRKQKTKRCICNSNQPEKVDYANLGIGECFLWGGDFYIKAGFDQKGVCLEDGCCIVDMCGEKVIPATNVKIRYDLKVVNI